MGESIVWRLTLEIDQKLVTINSKLKSVETVGLWPMCDFDHCALVALLLGFFCVLALLGHSVGMTVERCGQILSDCLQIPYLFIFSWKWTLMEKLESISQKSKKRYHSNIPKLKGISPLSLSFMTMPLPFTKNVKLWGFSKMTSVSDILGSFYKDNNLRRFDSLKKVSKDKY